MDDKAVEALARSLLRQQMLNSGWYPKLQEKERMREIEQDVERYWHLKIPEARQRLSESRAGSATD